MRYLEAVDLDCLAPAAYGQAMEEMCWVVCIGARQTDWDVGKAWGTFFSLPLLPSFLCSFIITDYPFTMQTNPWAHSATLEAKYVLACYQILPHLNTSSQKLR